MEKKCSKEICADKSSTFNSKNEANKEVTKDKNEDLTEKSSSTKLEAMSWPPPPVKSNSTKAKNEKKGQALVSGQEQLSRSNNGLSALKADKGAVDRGSGSLKAPSTVKSIKSNRGKDADGSKLSRSSVPQSKASAVEKEMDDKSEVGIGVPGGISLSRKESETVENQDADQKDLKLVVKSFTALSSKELTLVAGERVTDLRKGNDHWCYVKNQDNQKGYIPIGCLKEDKSEWNGHDEVEEVMVAKDSYVSKSLKEISVQEGDCVTVLYKKHEPWWYVKIGDKEGYIPSVCLTVESVVVANVQNNLKTVVSTHDYEKKSPKQISMRKGDTFVVIPNEEKNSYWLYVELKDDVGYVPAALVKKVVPDNEEDTTVIAKCDYQKRSSKELNLRKGERYTILWKDHVKWWYVEVQNKGGFVPSKFVKMFKDVTQDGKNNPETSVIDETTKNTPDQTPNQAAKRKLPSPSTSRYHDGSEAKRRVVKPNTDYPIEGCDPLSLEAEEDDFFSDIMTNGTNKKDKRG